MMTIPKMIFGMFLFVNVQCCFSQAFPPNKGGAISTIAEKGVGTAGSGPDGGPLMVHGPLDINIIGGGMALPPMLAPPEPTTGHERKEIANTQSGPGLDSKDQTTTLGESEPRK